MDVRRAIAGLCTAAVLALVGFLLYAAGAETGASVFLLLAVLGAVISLGALATALLRD